MVGQEQKANETFDAIAARYNELKELTAEGKVKKRPVVLSGEMRGGNWYAVGGESFLAQLFKDAGADYFLKNDKRSGGVTLDFETVYNQGDEADYWRIVNSYPGTFSYEALKEQDPRYADFRAFREKGIIYCNMKDTPFYESMPTEPEVVLADLLHIFHPDLLPDHTPVYYARLKEVARMRHSTTFLMSLIVASILVLMFLNLVLGSVSIPLKSVWNIICGLGDEPVTWQNIVWKSRLPQALTALVAGAGLAISGLQMQTVFRNPLAGPSVLGISSGASMGVAFVVLLSGSLGGVALSKLGFMGEIALSIAAVIGSLSVMALIVYVSQKVKGNVTLLIGVMIGYVANAVIGVLKFFSVEEDIRAYVIWGLGSFSRVSGNQMMLFVAIMAILIPLSFLLIKTLNLMLLGDGYARNLGLNIKRARLW